MKWCIFPLAVNFNYNKLVVSWFSDPCGLVSYDMTNMMHCKLGWMESFILTYEAVLYSCLEVEFTTTHADFLFCIFQFSVLFHSLISKTYAASCICNIHLFVTMTPV